MHACCTRLACLRSPIRMTPVPRHPRHAIFASLPQDTSNDADASSCSVGRNWYDSGAGCGNVNSNLAGAACCCLGEEPYDNSIATACREGAACCSSPKRQDSDVTSEALLDCEAAGSLSPKSASTCKLRAFQMRPNASSTTSNPVDASTLTHTSTPPPCMTRRALPSQP